MNEPTLQSTFLLAGGIIPTILIARSWFLLLEEFTGGVDGLDAMLERTIQISPIYVRTHARTLRSVDWRSVFLDGGPATADRARRTFYTTLAVCLAVIAVAYLVSSEIARSWTVDATILLIVQALVASGLLLHAVRQMTGRVPRWIPRVLGWAQIVGASVVIIVTTVWLSMK
jgi:hypothetical protein